MVLFISCDILFLNSALLLALYHNEKKILQTVSITILDSAIYMCVSMKHKMSLFIAAKFRNSALEGVFVR